MSLPLEQVRVLDLSRVLAGPYCTMLLGDLGADVVKVERPQSGDDTRQWGPPFIGGQGAYFLCCNRNKRSLTLNLKSPRGQEIVRTLATNSDVVVENFLPGTLDEIGLGYEALSRINPRLVFCSITGFGQTGPLRNEPGYDIMIQARAGVMSITGEPDGQPMKVGVAISDITAGLFAANAILASLLSRERTGRGDRIDISLYDCTVAWLANVGSNYLVSGEVPRRHGTAHPNIVPYQAFQAADGSLIVAVGNDTQFQRFCDVIGRSDLAADPRFSTNSLRVQHRDELLPVLRSIFQQRPVAEWLVALEQAQVPTGPVNTMDRVFADPQVAARDMVWPMSHPTADEIKLVGSPLKFAAADAPPRRPPPLLGEHTGQILHELLGISEAETEQLQIQSVI
ncbi:MAG: CoA transferase [Planctomycetales bacterium]|nr:CoA transferase [Planctomycetales bacterium]